MRLLTSCFSSHSCATAAPPAPPPVLPPSPSPHPCSGRAVGSTDIHNLMVNVIIITVSVLAGAALLSIALSVVIRRRGIRRSVSSSFFRSSPDSGGAGGGRHDGDEGGGLHHVWYIRTVGLDEATIESIAATPYRSGTGAGGDCPVCLAEFRDGELVRLLPKCGHVFHATCIRTWLRAHISCPICRTTVVDPPAACASVEAEHAAAPFPSSSHSSADEESDTHDDAESQNDDDAPPDTLALHSPEQPNCSYVSSDDTARPLPVTVESSPGDDNSSEEGSANELESSEKHGAGSKSQGSNERSSLPSARRRIFLQRHCRTRSSRSVLPF